MGCCCNEDNFDPGALGGDQVFRYVATGAEAAQFTVTLPAARPDANYNVFITKGGPAGTFVDAQAIVSTFTVTDFDIEAAVAPALGEIFMILVKQLT